MLSLIPLFSSLMVVYMSGIYNIYLLLIIYMYDLI